MAISGQPILAPLCIPRRWRTMSRMLVMVNYSSARPIDSLYLKTLLLDRLGSCLLVVFTREEHSAVPDSRDGYVYM